MHKAALPAAQVSGPADGTLDWYAGLFCPMPQRAAIAALHDLAEAIRQIGEKVTDPLPARMRLGWWGEELALLATGGGRHPASRALAPHLQHAAASDPTVAAQVVELLGDVLKAVEDDVAGIGCATLDELHQYGYRSRGAQLGAAARLFGSRADVAQRLARYAGACIGTSIVVCRLGADLHYGRRLLLPLDMLEEAGIGENTEATPAMLEPILATLAASCESAAAQVDEHARGHGSSHRLARILVALHRDQCRRALHLTRTAVPTRPVQTPPLRRLWVAWRAGIDAKREEA